MQGFKIYLDNCCFNRPFDDLSNDIVRLESESILTIIDKSEIGEWNVFRSDILDDEIDKITDIVRKQKVLALYSSTLLKIELNEEIIDRAKQLNKYNIKPYDALHLASAEFGKADIFLTTDKKLINLAKKTNTVIEVLNPVIWLMEVLYNGD